MNEIDPSKVVPHGNYVVIDVDAPKEMTEGGLHIPSTDPRFKDNWRRGTIRAIGKGRVTDEGKRTPAELSLGDRVLFNDHIIGHDTFHVLTEKPRVVVCLADNCIAKLSEEGGTANQHGHAEVAARA